MTSLTTIVNRIVDNPRRRGSVIVDINADYIGHRPTGDPRLDLARIQRLQ